MSSGIYVIRNLVNDKLYVGKSVHIENRWLEHQSDLGNGRHANIHLQRAYDKYGPDNLLHEVLELCEEDVLDSREIYWINHFGGHESERLYNMTAGGEGFAGGHHTEEAKKKIAQAQVGKPPIDAEARAKISEAHKGKVVSAETRERMRQAQLGKKRVFTEEHRRNISEARKGKKMSEEQKQHLREVNTGKKLSEEHRRKISQGNIGRVHSEETRRKISESRKRRLGTL